MKPKVLLIWSLMEWMLDVIHEQYDAVHWWELEDREKFLAESGADIRAVVTGAHIGADRPLMESLPNLEIITSYGVGFDTIDIQAAKERNVIVTNTPDVLTDDVADLAIGMLVCLFRGIHQGDRYIREGRWLKGPMPLMRAVKGSRLGIVGLGRIGRAIARRAEPMGMQIAYTDVMAMEDVSWPRYPDVKTLAENSDILCLSCNATPENKHLANAEILEALGPQGVVVNPARGSLVDEQALIQALEQNKIWGAALDVFENEPNVPEGLLKHPRVLVQPHVGSATEATRRAMGELVLENLRRYFAGEKLLTPVE